MRDAELAPDPVATQQALDFLTDIRARFQAAMTDLTVVGMTPQKQQIADQSARLCDQYVQDAQTVLGPPAPADDYAGWIQANESQVLPLSTLRANFDSLVQAETAAAQAGARTAGQNADGSRTVLRAPGGETPPATHRPSYQIAPPRPGSRFSRCAASSGWRRRTMPSGDDVAVTNRKRIHQDVLRRRPQVAVLSGLAAGDDVLVREHVPFRVKTQS